MSTLLPNKNKKTPSKRITRHPLFSFNGRVKHKKGGNFYFGLFSVVLFGFLFFSSSSLAQLSSFDNKGTVSLSFALKNNTLTDDDELFFDKNAGIGRETPDLKIIQDSFVYGVAAPHVIGTQTYAAIMGGPTQIEERKEIIDDYTVEEGETLDVLAAKFGISKKTIALANNISTNATLKVGQQLMILPVDGILYTVKSGDTLSRISQTYKVPMDDIIAFNELGDATVYIGDALILKGAIIPAKPAPTPVQIVLPNTFFLSPVLHARVTQGLHPDNAIDLASICGTPIYAAAGGTVQRAGYDRIGGNRVTILHSNGTVTYYGHLQTILVKPGDQVVSGDRIGSMGKTGKATGCHLHYQVHGAKNPFARYLTGSVIDVSK